MSISINEKQQKILEQKEIGADENVLFLRSLLDQAGHIGRGAGTECVGYAVVFFYKNKFMPEFEYRCHSEVSMLSKLEKVAFLGHRLLGIHIGKKYGKKGKL